jgi:hypothetical protein
MRYQHNWWKPQVTHLISLLMGTWGVTYEITWCFQPTTNSKAVHNTPNAPTYWSNSGAAYLTATIQTSFRWN